MRALLAATLALLVLAAAAAPHEHVHASASHECIACAVGQGDAAHDETPDVAPVTVVEDAPADEPGPAPVTGAPAGAVPGQSPPAGA